MKKLLLIIVALVTCATLGVVTYARCRCDGCYCSGRVAMRAAMRRANRAARRGYQYQFDQTTITPNSMYPNRVDHIGAATDIEWRCDGRRCYPVQRNRASATVGGYSVQIQSVRTSPANDVAPAPPEVKAETKVEPAKPAAPDTDTPKHRAPDIDEEDVEQIKSSVKEFGNTLQNGIDKVSHAVNRLRMRFRFRSKYELNIVNRVPQYSNSALQPRFTE